MQGVPVGLLQFGELQAELEALLLRKVDLVSKRGLRPLGAREEFCNNSKPVYAG